MSLQERRASLIKQINNVSDEQTLAMLEVSLQYYTKTNSKDITDGLDPYQFKELVSRVEEPGEKDTISEEEFKKLFARWSTK